MSTWTSFVKIWTVSNCESNPNFLTFFLIYTTCFLLKKLLELVKSSSEKKPFQFWREIWIWDLTNIGIVADANPATSVPPTLKFQRNLWKVNGMQNSKFRFFIRIVYIGKYGLKTYIQGKMIVFVLCMYLLLFCHCYLLNRKSIENHAPVQLVNIYKGC